MLRVLCAALALAGAAADRPAPHHVVNLDLPPAHRWDEIGAKYSEQIKFTLGWVQQQTNNPILKPVVNDLRAALKQHGGWSKEWVEEMHGLARAANVTVDLAETANLFYEWDPGCTSIVAQTPQGNILHARNQDYDIPGLANITIDVSFTRKGKVVYRGNTFAGYIGLPTAMKTNGGKDPNAWSVSADSRFTGDHLGKFNLLENIVVAKEGGRSLGEFIRSLVAGEAANYKEAIAVFNITKLIAPAYYIIAGTKPGEGAVVSRDRFGPDTSGPHGLADGLWTLENKSCRTNKEHPLKKCDPKSWWRLETNFDHWVKIEQDGRRNAANKAMEKIGQKAATLETLDTLLSTPPVLAMDTDYSAFMDPANGIYRSVIRSH